jgi:glycerol-3-phosphate acyltransferase PlsY
VGSGNPGATNVGRALGWPWAVLVGVADVLKGFLPALAFGWVSLEAGLVAGLAAVLGHVTSPWLHGRGGRGVATSLGAVLAIEPAWAGLVLVAFAVTVVLTRWVGLASMVAAFTLVVVAWVVSGLSVELLWALLLAVVVEVRHAPHVWQRVSRGRSAGG